MSDVLKVMRLHFVLLAVFAVGRWLQGAFDVPYEKGHHVFSLFILTALSAAFYAAFCRRWRGYRLGRALLLGYSLGLATQVVIFLATLLSYALGMQTYFNHPTALNVTAAIPMGEAMMRRALGLVLGPITPVVAALIGWALGALLPAPSEAASMPSAAATPAA